jgi:hypothetical protein
MEKIEKKHRSVRLTEKDLLLFDFVARFGFANVGQLYSYLGGSLNSLKTRLSHLVNDGYLVNHRIFFGKPSVYTITVKGNRTGLASVKEISVGGYEHDLLVIDVFLKLRERFVSYTTEKMIRAERGVGVGKSGRIPDLVGQAVDGKVIALEVDRTDKSLDRVQKIVNTYAMEFKYQEVWFICANQLIYNNLEKVNLSDKIKLFHLKDVLDGKELVYVKKSGVSQNENKLAELRTKYGSNIPDASIADANIAAKVDDVKPGMQQSTVFNLDDYLKDGVKPVADEPKQEEKKPGKIFGGFKFGK